jgi:hypothetical protein
MQELLEQTLIPQAAVTAEAVAEKERMHLLNKAITLTDYAPLYSAATIAAERGLQLGDLQAIIELPNKTTFFNEIGELAILKDPNLPDDLKAMVQYANTDFVEPIFCFKQTAVGKHAAEPDVRFLFMTNNQVEMLAAAEANDFPDADDVLKHVLVLELGQRQAIGKTADGQHWLPGIGFDMTLIDKEGMKYQAVSRDHATLAVDEHGQLSLEDHSKNGTHLVVNPERAVAQIDK